MCPIHFHVLFFISFSMGSCLVHFHGVVLDTLSDHCRCRILCRYMLMMDFHQQLQQSRQKKRCPPRGWSRRPMKEQAEQVPRPQQLAVLWRWCRRWPRSATRPTMQVIKILEIKVNEDELAEWVSTHENSTSCELISSNAKSMSRTLPQRFPNRLLQNTTRTFPERRSCRLWELQGNNVEHAQK